MNIVRCAFVGAADRAPSPLGGGLGRGSSHRNPLCNAQSLTPALSPGERAPNRRRFSNVLAVFFGALIFSTLTHAATERLDDSMSPRSSVEPAVTTTNGSVFDGAAPTEATLQFGWVEYRLNTAKYVGKNARIYYVVPAAIGNLRSPSGLRVEWRGRNTFKSGSARAGERILVWSGVVTTPRMEDALDLKMGLALSEMQGPIRFESYFEIEVN
jgi:hypothetical protein